MRAYFVLGMRRSGNHCIIQSIIETFQRVTYYNNISCTPIKTTYQINRTKMEPSVMSRVVSPECNPQAFIFSMEDITLDKYNKLASDMIARYNITEAYYVVICRDLLNLLASRVVGRHSVYAKIYDIWRSHVSFGDDDSHNKVVVHYNKFLTDEGYRSTVTQKLGLERTLNVPVSVPLYGDGSSFVVGSRQPQEVEHYLTRYKDPAVLSRLTQLKVPIDDIKYSERAFEIQYDLDTF